MFYSGESVENQMLKDISNNDICNFIVMNTSNLRSVSIENETYHGVDGIRVMSVQCKNGKTFKINLDNLKENDCHFLRNMVIYFMHDMHENEA